MRSLAALTTEDLMMADGLQPRATGILGMIGQLFNQGRQPSGAATYPFVPPERIPESLPMPLMGVDRNMPAQTAPEAPTLNPESGARALLGLGIRRPSEAGARARRALDPDYERQLPKEERRKDQGALSVLGNFLGNQEAMAQLAIAFNSMRMNPDAGLAASMQNLVERGGERRSASRTAEWLRSQGRTDLGDLVEQNPGLASEAVKQAMGGAGTESFRTLEQRAAAAGLEPGTSAYQEFMRMGGRTPEAGTTVDITMPGEQLKIMPDGRVAIADPSVEGGVRFVTPPGSKAGAETAGKEAERATNLAVWDFALNNLEESLLGTSTGFFAGLLPGITASQQKADQAIARMGPVLKQIFRQAGEGAFTDKDQEQLERMIPDRGTAPELIADAIRNINNLVRLKLGDPSLSVEDLMNQPMQPRPGPADSSEFRIIR